MVLQTLTKQEIVSKTGRLKYKYNEKLLDYNGL